MIILNTSLSNYIRIITVTKTVSIPANGYYHIENLAVSIPSGYSLVNFLTCSTSRDMTFGFAYNFTDTGIDAYIQNLNPSQVDALCTFKILAVKL